MTKDPKWFDEEFDYWLEKGSQDESVDDLTEYLETHLSSKARNYWHRLKEERDKMLAKLIV